MKLVFEKIVAKIEKGTLNVTYPDSTQSTFKGQNDDQLIADLHIHSWKMIPLLIKNTNVGIGESYHLGYWSSSNIEQLLFLLVSNKKEIHHNSTLNKIMGFLRQKVFNRNSLGKTKKHIAAHYDLSNDFYKLWLDPKMNYSSALFSDESMTLEEAQMAKLDRILSFIKPHKKVLDIGCGWGAFIERARAQGKEGFGITLSEEQFDYAKKRLGDDAVKLIDYRQLTGQFDAVVSIGMLEHVGMEYWKEYFEVVAARLKKGGTAVIQTIVDSTEEEFQSSLNRDTYIRKYIFPGGCLPTVDRCIANAKNAGLQCKDVFLFGKSYARTCRTWHQNVEKNKDKIKAMGFDDQFLLMWKFYLLGCAAFFETEKISVCQLVFEHA